MRRMVVELLWKYKIKAISICCVNIIKNIANIKHYLHVSTTIGRSTLNPWDQIIHAKSSSSTKRIRSFPLSQLITICSSSISSRKVKQVRSLVFKADKIICPRVTAHKNFSGLWWPYVAVKCTSFVSTECCMIIYMCLSAGWEGKCLLIFESGSSSTPPSSSLILTLIFVLTRLSFSFSFSREMLTFHNLSLLASTLAKSFCFFSLIASFLKKTN